MDGFKTKTDAAKGKTQLNAEIKKGLFARQFDQIWRSSRFLKLADCFANGEKEVGVTWQT